MNVNSLSFIYLFLPIFLAVYYLTPNRAKNAVIVAGSVLFYAWGEPIYVFSFALLSLFVYIFGLILDHFRKDRAVSLVVLAISLAVLFISLLAFQLRPYLLGWIFSASSLWLLPAQIPIGLAFYTLSCGSYLLDIFRGKAASEHNFIHYMVYLSLFPKLLGGPTVLYHQFAPQLRNHPVHLDDMADGIGLFAKGLAKKVLLADNLAPVCTAVLSQDPAQLTAATAWFGILAAMLWVYYDFSGYFDLARGLGMLLGFRFPVNMRAPFLARSLSEFFRRWHISLMHWFNAYLFEPLGGNRKGNLRTVVNLLLTVMAVSFWHGIGYGYQAGALFVFAVLLGEELLWGRAMAKLPGFVRRLYTFLMILFPFVLVTQNHATRSFQFFGALLGLNHQPFYNDATIYYLITYGIVFLLAFLLSSRFAVRWKHTIKRYYPRAYTWGVLIFFLAALVMSTAYLVNTAATPFLLFQI